MNEQNSYYAFISYNSADEKWAKWLQHNLEYYHIPSALCKEYPELPKKIRPVFWYKQDLSGTKLKKALNNELSSSKYLIVICSPDSAKADWVNDEVVAFIEQGKGDRIIPFIVAGTPHAKNPEEECFPPALRNLTRDEEIRGIDVRRKEGKSHALVDVIATMFGVRFDVLWQRHERRRKRIRNIWIAVASVFLLCALGIYDYNRTKVEYYADFVDRWGVAEGIIPLDDDQVSHRHHSYKFEYTRVPFGEKDFYSWRLKRVSLVNSKGVISDYVPDHHAFFYPIQEFEYTDGYVTDIINRDTYKRVVMRYSVKDDYEHNTACLIDMEGKEKRQGSAYLDASTTSMMPDVNSNSTKSKIKRFHYTRNEDGYVTKITYHANDGDDLEETAIGDNNNIFGKLFELDSLGRVVTLSYINNEGYLMTDKFGVGSIKYTYDSLGETATTKYLNNNKQLANNEQKFATICAKFDKYGNIIEQWNMGADGQPCFDYQNIYNRVITYDSNGCMTEIRFCDFEGNLSYCSENYAIQRAKYDSKGRWLETSHFDIEDKPCYIKNNYSISRTKYNSNDCIIEWSFYDTNGSPCLETIYGAHLIKTKLNENNYAVEQAIYDTAYNAIISPIYGFHRQVNEYDNYHQLIASRVFDTDGDPCINTQELCSYGCYSYDTRGNLTKIECYNIEGNLCVCKSGYASIVYKYDNFGNLASEAYYGIDDKPIYINMCSSVQYDYYPNGKVKECRYYDENQQLTLNNNWYAISRHEYDNNGNQTQVKFYDSDTIPCYYKDGLYHCLHSIYDVNNNVIQETYYNTDLYPISISIGNYAIAKYKYDNKSNRIEYSYFDENEMPCYNKEGYHKVNIKFDNRRNPILYAYFDISDRSCANNLGASYMKLEYDNRNNITVINYLDQLNHNTNIKSLGYSIERKCYDQYNRVIKHAFYDINDKPTWYNMQFSTIEFTYDSYGNIIRKLLTAPDGKLSPRFYAICDMEYDNISRITSIKYYDHSQQPIGGDYFYPIETYHYETNHKKVSIYQNDSTLITHINHYYENGLLKKLTFTDIDNNLHIKYLQGVTDIPSAVICHDYNEKGLVVKSSFFDDNNQPFNTEGGMAYTITTYNEKGQPILHQYYDTQNKLVNATVSGAAYVVYNYDKYGNLIEESFYDKNDQLATTPWSWSRRIKTFDGQGKCISDIYHMPNGTIYSADNTVETTNTVTEVQDSRDVIPEEVRTVIQLRVEKYGQMFEAGFYGTYIILEWNDWNIMNPDIMGSFIEAFSSSKGKEKRLVLLPVTESGFGEIIEYRFSPDALSARVMDNIHDTDDFKKDIIKLYLSWKK